MRVRERGSGARRWLIGGVAAAALAAGVVVVAMTTARDESPGEVVQVTERALDVPIAMSADDATETLSTGLVELQAADLELGSDAEPQLVGLRFDNLQIPPGSSITSAHIQFASARYADAETSLVFSGHAADSAEPFSRVAGNLSSRAKTAAQVSWAPPAWFGVGELGPSQRSPELAPVISEIVGRPGWDSGNALVVLVEGEGRRSAESFDGPLSLPPILRVTWDEPVDGNTPPAVNAGVDQRIDVGEQVELAGDVQDDGVGTEPLSSVWSTVDGPVDATFEDASSPTTSATFTEPGVYTLRLSASDGAIIREDLVVVTVIDPNALPPPTRFAVIGDYGLPGPGESVVAALVQREAPDFVVTVGDNAYVPQIDDAVGAYYADFIGDYTGSFGQGASTNRFFPALGNHEETDLVGGLDDYLDYFTLPGEGIESTNTSGNERYYDFVQGPVHFFVVNSNSTEPDGRSATSVQAQWLERALGSSEAPWKVVVTHHPPYSSAPGAGQTPALRWPFGTWGADAVLSGHAHVYERLELDGVLYFVNGIGGEGAASLAPDLLPETRARYNGGFGAMFVEACAHRIEFSLHSINEGVVDTHALGSTDCSGGAVIDQTPYVYAGRDVTTPAATPLALSGVVADDSEVTIAWSQESGPGQATFAPPGAAATTVTFSQAGAYVLSLSASDGRAAVTDIVEVVVTDDRYRSIDTSVAETADDAEQRLGSGLVQIESTDLGLGVGSQPQLVGVRFGSIAVPRGATIERAYVQFAVDEVDRDSASLTISGELSSDAAPFAPLQLDISSRPVTSASVAWSPPEWLAVRAAGEGQRTPDLSAVVQEIVDQPDWSSGNAMAVIISGSGTRTAESADGQPGSGPKLHIEYSLQ